MQAVLDKSDERDHGRKVTGARFLVEANIPTWIDDSVAIAHSKVIIIDGHLVIGGSYNYTASAEHRNAENVTFIDAPATMRSTEATDLTEVRDSGNCSILESIPKMIY